MLLHEGPGGSLELGKMDFAVATPLSEQLALLRSVLGGASEGITVSDADLSAPGPRILLANEAFCRLTGYSPEELVGRDHALLHGTGTERDVLDELHGCLEAGEPFRGEVTCYRKDGSPLRTAWRVEAIRDAEGLVVGYVWFHGEASPTEADRHPPSSPVAADDRFRSLVEHMPAVPYTEGVPPVPDEFYVGPQLEEMMGYSPDEWRSEMFFWKSVIHPDDLDQVVQANERSDRTLEPFSQEYRMIAKDGRVVWVHDAATVVIGPDGTPLMWQGAWWDITDRKGIEEKVRRAEHLYRTLVEQIPAVTYLWQTDAAKAKGPAAELLEWSYYTSPQIKDLLGFDREEWDSQPDLWKERLHPDDRERVLAASANSERTGQPFVLEYRYLRKDGSPVWVRDEARLLSRDEEGRPEMFQGLMFDIDDRVHQEEALSESLRRFQVLASEAPVGIFQADTRGRCSFVNGRWMELTGLTEEQAMGTGWSDALHPDDRARVAAGWEQAVSTSSDSSDEFRFRTPDGVVRWVAGHATPLRDATGGVKGYLGTVTDITERVSAEEVLRESVEDLTRTLEGLRRTDRERRLLVEQLVQEHEEERGRIVEGIVDDPIQQMTAVGLRLDMLRRGLSDPEQLGALDRLGESVEQAAGRLRSLMLELRPRTLDREGLGPALREYVQHAASEAGVEAAFEDRVGVELGRGTRATAYRIAQEAITNVLSHAGAGRVEVSLSRVENGVRVRIVDDGSGFDPEGVPPDLRLGIATMRERAELGGGWLRISSAPGSGTTVEYWLPIEAAT